jgi:hypothetical protein
MEPVVGAGGGAGEAAVARDDDAIARIVSAAVAKAVAEAVAPLVARVQELEAKDVQSQNIIAQLVRDARDTHAAEQARAMFPDQKVNMNKQSRSGNDWELIQLEAKLLLANKSSDEKVDDALSFLRKRAIPIKMMIDAGDDGLGWKAYKALIAKKPELALRSETRVLALREIVVDMNAAVAEARRASGGAASAAPVTPPPPPASQGGATKGATAGGRGGGAGRGGARSAAAKCVHCGKQGHVVARCWQRAKEERAAAAASSGSAGGAAGAARPASVGGPGPSN